MAYGDGVGTERCGDIDRWRGVGKGLYSLLMERIHLHLYYIGRSRLDMIISNPNFRTLPNSKSRWIVQH